MAGKHSPWIRTITPLVTMAGAAILFLGCPGELENPERFVDADLTQVCPDIVQELFVMRCAGSICHEGAEPAGGLDLISPNVESRLIDVQGRDCPGLLVDPVLPEASLLYQKLLPLPDCGSPMPVGKPVLNGFELECVREWIATRTPTGN